eukprot:12614482-Alexandrium_andersonii.AAC.1
MNGSASMAICGHASIARTPGDAHFKRKPVRCARKSRSPARILIRRKVTLLDVLTGELQRAPESPGELQRAPESSGESRRALESSGEQ